VNIEFNVLAANPSRFAMYSTYVSPQDSSLFPPLFAIGRAKFSLASWAKPWSKENKLNRNKTNNN
jgi:hypothetical protein